MLGMAGGLQGMQQRAFAPALSEWQRMTPEANPWLQYGMQFPYGSFQQTPQQYQQSPFSQFVDVAAQFLPLFLGGGGAALPAGMLEAFYPSEWGELR